MAKLLWYALQLTIIGDCVWLWADDHRLGKPDLGKVLLIGVLFAFVTTLGVIILQEQWLLWSGLLRRRMAKRQQAEHELGIGLHGLKCPHGGNKVLFRGKPRPRG